jgi:hypothetical protein
LRSHEYFGDIGAVAPTCGVSLINGLVNPWRASFFRKRGKYTVDDFTSRERAMAAVEHHYLCEYIAMT